MSGSDIQLYSYWRSSSSWRVRNVLELKKLPYQYIAVNLLKAEQHTDEYTQINKSEVIPTLVYKGSNLCQSTAIVEFLEEVHGEVPLFPADHVLKCKVREIMSIIAADIQPIQNMKVLKEIEAGMGPDAKLAWAKRWITQGFTALEKVLEGCHGKFCVGDEVTLADCFLVPQVYNGNRFGVDMQPFPLISSINAECLKLEPFMRAHPDTQPDAPKE